MICLLLIMTMIFVDGIENAEQKVKHSDTVLREEEMDAKTKAWLLMVESGKVDEEDLRKITPKSIFIAPLLTSRTGKCKEGYRHDHLGQCVKVIKIDPKVQFELLLKRLSTLYGDRKLEEEDEQRPEISNGPLHFSIPISNEEEKRNVSTIKDPKLDAQFVVVNSSNILSLPIPSPIVMLNQTQEIESSGEGPLNYTESYVTSHFEGSGIASEETLMEEQTTSSTSFLSEDTDYLDSNETESTTDILSSTEIMSITTVDPEYSTTPTESYQSVTKILSVNKSVEGMPNGNIKTPEVVTNKSKSDVIHFPSDKEERTNFDSSVDNSYIRFPDDSQQRQKVSNYHSSDPSFNWNPAYQILPSAIPRQQFWWLPENWKVDETRQKSSLVKFWSRLPLIHDVSLTDESRNGFKKSSNQPRPQLVNSKRRNNDFTVGFNAHSLRSRRGKPFRNNRLFQDFVATPSQTFKVQR